MLETTLGQLDSCSYAKVIIALPTRAAVKFTKERLILATEGHKLDSQIEPWQRGEEQWTKREKPMKPLVVMPNEAPLQVNTPAEHLVTPPRDAKSRVGEAAFCSICCVIHSVSSQCP